MPKKKIKNAIGRGLEAYFVDLNNENENIIPNKSVAEDRSEKDQSIFSMMPLEDLIPNPNQPRREFNKQFLQELCDSIIQHGIIQPLTVRELKDKNRGKYQIIRGERRYRAAKKAGLMEVPVYIRQAYESQVFIQALVENIQREQLGPLEEAWAYHQLIEDMQWTQRELAKQIGKNRPAIANTLRLLKLPDIVQAALKEGKISVGHAKDLLSVQDYEQVRVILDYTIKKQLSVRDIEDLVKSMPKILSQKLDTPSKMTNIETVHMSKEISKNFSTKVRIRPTKSGGSIVIEFYSKDDLQRIYNRLTSLW